MKLLYCLRCRKKRDGLEVEEIILFSKKRGVKNKAIRGLCESCGTRMYRMTGRVKPGDDVTQIKHVGK